MFISTLVLTSWYLRSITTAPSVTDGNVNETLIVTPEPTDESFVFDWTLKRPSAMGKSNRSKGFTFCRSNDDCIAFVNGSSCNLLMNKCRCPPDHVKSNNKLCKYLLLSFSLFLFPEEFCTNKFVMHFATQFTRRRGNVK